MAKFYLTFPMKSQYRNCYVEIEAPNYMQARDKVFELFDTKWAFIYTEKEWVCNGISQAEEFNLTKIPI